MSRGGAARAGASNETLNELWTRAKRQVEGWRTIGLRLSNNATAPLAFTIDRGTGGQPQLRGTLVLDRATGEITRRDSFESQTLGRRLRSIARFVHTGEMLGVTGQTVAGLASAGAVVLVWTGLALALRRSNAWSNAVLTRLQSP